MIRQRASMSRRRRMSSALQKVTMTMPKMAARPTDCSSRSEKMAPSGPIQLRVAPPAAWVRLGSAADQEMRLSQPAAVSAARTIPASRQKLPFSRSSNGCGSIGLGS